MSRLPNDSLTARIAVLGLLLGLFDAWEAHSLLGMLAVAVGWWAWHKTEVASVARRPRPASDEATPGEDDAPTSISQALRDIGIALRRRFVQFLRALARHIDPGRVKPSRPGMPERRTSATPCTGASAAPGI